MTTSASQVSLSRGRSFGWLLALTIFVSAFLLFQVQPLIGKFILPWFGGSPAVWTTAMLFFQATLFFGYAYAHLVASRLALRTQVGVHLVLLVLAAASALFVIPSSALRPSGSDDPTWRILLILASGVGLPYFTLSTTGPLIQSWFSRAYPGRSPYRLYSLSNVGSLLALGSFPFLFEPYLELPTMGRFWIVGFWLFASLCALCAMQMLSDAPASAHAVAEFSEPLETAPAPALWQRAAWIGLAGLSSLTFIATTNHVCHDVATTPFLWIVPLALYLLTFIICFDHERWYVRGVVTTLCAFSILTLAGYETVEMWLWDHVTATDVGQRLMSGAYTLSDSDHLYHFDIELSFTQELVLHFVTMFLICMVCHGELVRLRPQTREHITEYYLMISAGGALGGLFITLVATNFFTRYHEWPLCLIAGFLVAGAALATQLRAKAPNPRLASAGAGLAGLTTLAGAVAVLLLLDPFDWREEPDPPGTESRILYRGRNFYGRVSVEEDTFERTIAAGTYDDFERSPADNHRTFYSGHVLHGSELTAPSRRRAPLAYYHVGSGLSRAIEYCQTRTCRNRPFRFAVIGLGVGTVATYARPAEGSRAADECVFYEINPLVETIARRDFWYLSDYEQRIGKPIEVRLGDARLTMEREEPQEFDLIVLDAFSGDSIPTHLLTREAFEVYARHLRKRPDGTIDGFLCTNITNSYINLYPVLKNAAEQVLHLPYTSVYTRGDRKEFAQRNHHFLITGDREFLKAVPPAPRYRTVRNPSTGQEETAAVDYDTPGIPLWTDHYSTIFSLLIDD